MRGNAVCSLNYEQSVDRSDTKRCRRHPSLWRRPLTACGNVCQFVRNFSSRLVKLLLNGHNTFASLKVPKTTQSASTIREHSSRPSATRIKSHLNFISLDVRRKMTGLCFLYHVYYCGLPGREILCAHVITLHVQFSFHTRVLIYPFSCPPPDHQ